MTFMESLIGMNFIRYVGSNMQRIITETIFLAGSSTDWQSCQLPDSVFSRAHQMLLTLSNIHNLNNIQNFGSTQSDQVAGNVADFLAGSTTSGLSPKLYKAILLCAAKAYVMLLQYSSRHIILLATQLPLTLLPLSNQILVKYMMQHCCSSSWLLSCMSSTGVRQ